MALFKVNTGTRQEEVCALRWEWEVPLPELETSVFLIPESVVKNGEERLVVLNSVARSIINSCRGMHPEFVFVYRPQMDRHTWKGTRRRPDQSQAKPPRPVLTMNNTAWQDARDRAAEAYEERFGYAAPHGFAKLRVHDLKHTFGRRLTAAGVPDEIKAMLLGHKTDNDITARYSAVEIKTLVEAAEKAVTLRESTPTLTLLRRVV